MVLNVSKSAPMAKSIVEGAVEPAPLPTAAPSVAPPQKAPSSKAEVKTSQKTTYEVGYGKPPKATQFKKGQSGNSNGRPKRPKPLEEILASELVKVVTVTLNGAPVKLTQAELMMKAAMRSAMGGNLSAIRLMMNAWGLLPAETAPQVAMSKDELLLLQQVIAEELEHASTDDTGGGSDLA